MVEVAVLLRDVVEVEYALEGGYRRQRGIEYSISGIPTYLSIPQRLVGGHGGLSGRRAAYPREAHMGRCCKSKRRTRVVVSPFKKSSCSNQCPLTCILLLAVNFPYSSLRQHNDARAFCRCVTKPTSPLPLRFELTASCTQQPPSSFLHQPHKRAPQTHFPLQPPSYHQFACLTDCLGFSRRSEVVNVLLTEVLQLKCKLRPSLTAVTSG